MIEGSGPIYRFDTPMIVADLIELLQTVPDDTQVTIALNECDPLSEFANISTVEIPDFEESFSVILGARDDFDARQF